MVNGQPHDPYTPTLNPSRPASSTIRSPRPQGWLSLLSCFLVFAAHPGAGNMHHLPSVLSVTGLLLLSSCCADLVSAGGGSGAGSANVTWITPIDGDSYAAGDTIVGRWAAVEAVVSPSFRICMTGGGGAQLSSRREKVYEEHTHDDGSGDDDDDGGSEDDGDGSGDDASGGEPDSGGTAGNCGQAVWPTIGQSDGSYFVHLSLPNVTSVAQCYLEMVDDFGDKMASPVFSFGASPGDSDASAYPATAAAAAIAAAGTPAASTEDAPTASDSPSSPSNISPSPAAESTPSPNADLDPDPSSNPSSSPDTSHSVKPTPSPSPSPNPKASSNPPSPKSSPDSSANAGTPKASMDDSHVPIPTAAYAVPLALVGSVILAAGALSVHQRRKLRHERALEHAALQTRGALLSRHSTLSFAGFVKLGRERAGQDGRGDEDGNGASVARSARTESRSTSVSRMRAWRRDVPHSSGSRASESTYAYRPDEEDARSVASYAYSKGFTAFPAPLARRLTREPFHAHARRNGDGGRASQTGAGARRATMVPASVWRAGVSPSPVFPSTDSLSLCTESDATPRSGRWTDRLRERDRQSLAREDEDGELGRLKRKGHALVDPGPVPQDTSSYLASSITDSVLDRYCLASPIPPSLSPVPTARGNAPSSVARPERLHVKRYAEADLERPEPERDLYDVVARRISRGPDV
ncbi:hypothetical protein FKP32DRAFT_1634067 [Trametes sanguinea]|nr:hypothetical protein FKP32DRAFT_1634067 [Trametes sanguinea]